MTENWTVDPEHDNRPSDVIVFVDSCRFHLHRDVLVENCDYFKAMFSSQMVENLQREITIQLFEEHPFRILVEGIYSKKLSLTFDSIFDVTVTAHILQATSVFNQCCEFFTECIDAENCFGIMSFSELHSIQETYDISRKFCLTHFLTLCKEESFYELNIDEVTRYLCDDHLVADEESEVVQALEDWCKINNFSNVSILQNIVAAITDSSKEDCQIIAEKLATSSELGDDILLKLKQKRHKQNLMLFWSRLSDPSKNGQNGLVDVVSLQPHSTGNYGNEYTGIRAGTMTTLVENPGFDLGSAVCVKGPYVYVCGGGPNFGRMDWIRDLWRYSVLEDGNKWEPIAKLPHVLRYHALVAVGTKLYMFGGFGTYRSKNCNLDSYDIIQGTWNKHAAIPKHETNPSSTVHQSTIFYICREWKVYAYDTRKDQWTVMMETGMSSDIIVEGNCLPISSGIDLGKPLSCFVIPDGSKSCKLKLIVFSTHKTYQSLYLSLDITNSSFCALGGPVKFDLDFRTNVYIRSCFIDGQPVYAFKCRDIDYVDEDFDDSDWSNIVSKTKSEGEGCCPLVLKRLIPETRSLVDWIWVDNVEMTQSLVAVPEFPHTFPLGPNSSSTIKPGQVQ